MVHSRYPQPSMEPPPFGDGNLGVLRRHVPEYRPSMEPPPFGDGNAENGTDRDPDVQPSMEPPPFGDGNGAASAMTCRMIRTLQWSHRPSAMETRPSPSWRTVAPGAFNGATALRRWKPEQINALITEDKVLQWSHRPSAMETGPGRQRDDRLLHPSMEPPPFGDGNRGHVGERVGDLQPSMEPPPFGDGNTPRTGWSRTT